MWNVTTWIMCRGGAASKLRQVMLLTYRVGEHQAVAVHAPVWHRALATTRERARMTSSRRRCRHSADADMLSATPWHHGHVTAGAITTTAMMMMSQVCRSRACERRWWPVSAAAGIHDDQPSPSLSPLDHRRLHLWQTDRRTDSSVYVITGWVESWATLPARRGVDECTWMWLTAESHVHCSSLAKDTAHTPPASLSLA